MCSKYRRTESDIPYFDVFQNLLVEHKGRRFMLMGGYILMTVWAVVFTIALLLEVS